MPVTKTAKRALRSSKRKQAVNKVLRRSLDVAIRMAKKKKSTKSIQAAVSLVDKAAKKGIVHRNKAARIKSQLSKLGPKPAKKSAPKKSSKK